MYKYSDDINIISSTLRAALKRAGEVIIIRSGLGATYDDLTLAAVAKAIKYPLILDDRALKMVDSKFEFAKRLGWTKNDKITDNWKKMAIIPKGSIPLENPPGIAPGIRIEYQGKTIFCSLGPPNELHSIFLKEIRPIIKQKVKVKLPDAHLYFKDIIEPTISSIVQETFTKFKGSKLFSRTWNILDHLMPEKVVHFPFLGSNDCGNFRKGIEDFKSQKIN